MARRVFFSFHWDDVWRANQVRNSWLVRPEGESPKFADWAEWEEVKNAGDESIKGWIDRQMNGASVTCVLIGSKTASRRYVQYEIRKSWERRMGLLGVRIHNLRDPLGTVGMMGLNSFQQLTVTTPTGQRTLSSLVATYDWQADRGAITCAFQSVSQRPMAAASRNC
jgi:MTH538 TIR-like domain (DUF1863)